MSAQPRPQPRLHLSLYQHVTKIEFFFFFFLLTELGTHEY